MRHLPSYYAYANPFLEPVSLDAVLTVGDGENGPLDIPDDAPSAEDRLAEAEAENAVRDFVAHLPVRDRELVQSVFWEGKSQAEVARDFHVSGAAISKRMARIIQHGRTALAAHRHTQWAQ